MDLNESAFRDAISFRQLENSALEIKPVLIWVAKHRVAKKYRYELCRCTSIALKCEILYDVLHKMKQNEIRLSMVSKITDSIAQINKHQGAHIEMRTATSQGRIERYQQDLTKYPLGRAWLIALKRVQQLDKAVSEEKQNVLSAKDELELAIKLHEIDIQKVKKEIQQIAGD